MNANFLKGKIIAAGYTVPSFCEKIKMTTATMYRRLDDNCSSFTMEETSKIIEVLKLTPDEFYEIFLFDKSQK